MVTVVPGHCRTLSPAVIAAAFAAGLTSAHAADPAGYGPVLQVHEYLTAGHRPGDLVAIRGFPLCSDVDECRLLSGREYVSPRVPFSAAGLEQADQERLLHCMDPERGAKPCIIVLYGEAMRGRSVAPRRIEWQQTD